METVRCSCQVLNQGIKNSTPFQIDTNEILNKGFKVFWTQAKDDIGPNDIFKICSPFNSGIEIKSLYLFASCG